ncbi:GNAT family N-acetyltransferase [Sabulilitoribacter multivorans]|uniref:GNAT family N-acetyltransferase n=1 Tax=Flaviramulus multivorans TaxID=1304750 RepID=A0ABS9IJM9_9FLAO|nr:peptidoglycan bridge formation glycyltransferase FemA/FemB family protein [Flaviramulus multivorans]MCF7560809.1 GNAT family N-acetyltransferase [Flaviramulus multivorans]
MSIIYMIDNLEIIYKKNKWEQVLKEVGNHDFYHTYDYHYLSKLSDEKPVLLKYSEDDKLICFPLLLRKINNTVFFDATSVYGYPGPVQKNISTNFNNSKFSKALQQYFIKENIISVFSRLNPYIDNQYNVLQNIGEVQNLGKVVNINLKLSLDKQYQAYSKTTKRYINKCRKHCNVIKSNSPEDIDKFIELYYSNMERVNAKKRYYFTKDYFLKFISSEAYKTDILFAVMKDTGEIISSALMVKSDNIVQYHLSGTKEAFLNLSPIRLLIDEMRIIASKENKTYFNLGGGLGNLEDGLFKFKSSFSNDFKPFKIWKFIANVDVYDTLVKENLSVNNKTNFFPLYRYDS